MVDITINSRILRITGSAELPENLEIGHDYTLGLTGNCYSKEARDNQAGGVDVIYKIRLLGDLIITKDFGKQIRAKVKGSPSQKLRNVLFMIHSERNIEKDFQDWYPEIMNKIISNIDEII